MTTEDRRARVRAYVQENAAKGPDHVISLARAEWNRLEGLIADVSEDEAVAKPLEGEWSIAEVIHHITLSHRGNVERIDTLSNGRPYSGPPPVPGALPEDPPATFAEARRNFLDLVERAVEAIEKADPGAHLDLTTPHVAFGEYSWIEWATHMHVHARDHIAQVEKIKQALEAQRNHV
jgi:DinB superfamily